MTEQLEMLQSGTDIRGIAVETEEKQVNLTTDIVQSIAYGFFQWLINKRNITGTNCKVAVGMDSRLSGPKLKAAMIDSLTNVGCQVYDCEMSTTPAMFMTTVLDQYQCDGAMMITASHLPYYYNGLKFFTAEGGCEKEDIRSILQLASKVQLMGTEPHAERSGLVCKTDLIEDYAKLLVHIIRKGVNSRQNYEQPLTGFKIIVDAGNGAGGFFADKVLKTLGADTAGSQFLEPDGSFPNHSPNPENQAAMESIKAAVLKHKADLGIIFDADVDRAAIVSADGAEINRNMLIALLSAIVLEEYPQSVIVTDSITSTGLSEFIDKLGGKHQRFKRGYKNVINEAKRLNGAGQSCHLAIETSGHAALQENYFLDDGAYLIAKILIKMAILKQQGKEIQSLIETLNRPYESIDCRISINSTNFTDYGRWVIENAETYVPTVPGWSIVPNNYEGIRVSADERTGNGWFLLRLSLHEPVLALNVESDSQDGIQMIFDKLVPFFKQYDALDLNNLPRSDVHDCFRG